MLKAIEIENFKAFGERTRIELAPITLIFGENSGGKSSILQVLSLLKQTQQSRESGAVLLPRVTGGIVDLGSYRNMLFDHDPNRQLSIRLDMETREDSVCSPRLFLGPDGRDESVGFQVTFCPPAATETVEVDTIVTYLNNRKVAVFQRTTATEDDASVRQDKSPDRKDSPRAVSRPVRSAKCTWVIDTVRARQLEHAENLARWIVTSLRQRQAEIGSTHVYTEEMRSRYLQLLQAMFRKLELEIDDAQRELRDELENLKVGMEELIDKYAPHLADAQIDVLPTCFSGGDWRLEIEKELKSLEKAIERPERLQRVASQLLPEDWDMLHGETGFESDDAITDDEIVEDTECDIVEEACNFFESSDGTAHLLSQLFDIGKICSIRLDGLFPVPEQESEEEYECMPIWWSSPLKSAFSELEGQDWFSEELVALLYGGAASAVESLAVEAGWLLRSAIDSVYPMGPYRLPPERWYIFAGTSPQDVGYRGQFLPDLLLRDGDLVTQTNHWLQRLGIGYQLEPTPLRSEAPDLFELRLLDRRRGTSVEVPLSDVGFGISQLLPFVVQCLASEQQIITIEQPEVHVHPRLQADIGDLLIDSIQEPRKHQFIVETHSEHLILRLLRRIRETHQGTLPEGHPGLRPEDVSVIYVRRTDSGSQALKIDIDLNGEFVQPWPDDFFELDFHERFA